jgi:F-type H+-transporting ATPase subunit b
MLIDWFTVGAQVLNFLILVWLMKRFLYAPILAAIDAREGKIAAELADAAATQAQAGQAREALEHKHQEFDQERAGLLDRATSDAQAERQRLLEEARSDAAAAREQGREQLRSEVESLGQALTQQTTQEVFAIARKTLSDLASTSLEERMCAAFLERLGAIDGEEKAQLGQALKTASQPALIRSAFELPEEQRSAIGDALNRAFSTDIQLRFEPASSLIGGIELSTEGHTLAWSIAGYLEGLGQDVDALIEQRASPVTEAS